MNFFSILFPSLWLLSSLGAYSAELLDDRAIRIHSVDDVVKTRGALIEYLWGKQGWPRNRMPDRVVTNVLTPVKYLENLRRVDELWVDLAPGLDGLAYHFVPAQPKAHPELVVVHHGHACTLDDDPSAQDVGNGMQRTIRALLGQGYGVLGVFMPHMRPGDCSGGHEGMFDIKTSGSPIRFFLEPTIVGLNYLGSPERSRTDQFPSYRKFHMVGLSGGGWTTTVCAAIDPRIRLSFPVAGTIPLYLRSGGSIGDREQFEPGFYRIAGYQDLYMLGATGEGRKQVQILVRKDDCCFGEAQHDARAIGIEYVHAMRQFEQRVQEAMKQFPEGSFRLEIDETAPGHMISHHTVNSLIIKELGVLGMRRNDPDH